MGSLLPPRRAQLGQRLDCQGRAGGAGVRGARHCVGESTEGKQQHLNGIQVGIKAVNTPPDSTQLPLQHA